MITNISEAAEYVANKLKLSPAEVLSQDLVQEYECEDSEEFADWYDADNNKLPTGTPIGYSEYIAGKEILCNTK